MSENAKALSCTSRCSATPSRSPRRSAKDFERKAAAKVLRRRRLGVVAESVGFFVEDSTGPLSEGELDRARAWGASLAARLSEHELDL